MIETFNHPINRNSLIDVTPDDATSIPYIENPDVTFSTQVREGDHDAIVSYIKIWFSGWATKQAPKVYEHSHVYAGPHPSGRGTLYQVSARLISV